MKINIKSKTYDEFKDLDDDIKWDLYSELVHISKNLVDYNERQFHTLENKDNVIRELKEILMRIIEKIGE